MKYLRAKDGMFAVPFGQMTLKISALFVAMVGAWS